MVHRVFVHKMHILPRLAIQIRFVIAATLRDDLVNRVKNGIV